MGFLVSLLGGIWSRVVLWAGIALGVLAAIAGIYRSGKVAGRNEVVVRGLEEKVENVGTRDEVETGVRRANDADRRRLRDKWSRD